MPRPAVWFKCAVWLGVVINAALALPAIVAPEWWLGLLRQRPTGDPVWTAFASFVIVLLSLFYLPGANDPYRYRFNAWLAVGARLGGVIFFFLLRPGAYPAFGFVDLFFFVVQLPLLLLVIRGETSASHPRM